MKIITYILLIMISISTNAYAIDYRVISIAALATKDYDQSVEMFYERGGYELNPLLGTKPSRSSLRNIGIASVVALYVVSSFDGKWKNLILDSVLSSEKFNVEENERVLNNRPRRINGIPIVVTFRW